MTKLGGVLGTLFLAIFLSACDGTSLSVGVGGKDVVKVGNDENSNYSYTENNCPTGTISYHSRDELCNALKDDARNNHCAQGMRYERFKQDCSGYSWN